MKESKETKENPADGILIRSLRILELIFRNEYSPNAAQISEILNIPRPTVNRLIAQLVQYGYLKREVSNKSLIAGENLEKLSLQSLRRSVSSGPQKEILRQLSLKVGETCNIATVSKGQALYLERVEADWPLTFRLDPGSSVPLHASAIGKMLLSQLSIKEQQKYAKSLFLIKYTAQTITDADELLQHLALINKQGYSIDDEEYLIGVRGLAVSIPLMKKPSTPIALAIAAPSIRYDLNALKQVLPDAQAAAKKLTYCFI